METKICPLLTIAGATTGEGQKLCQGEECAWYSPDGGSCAMSTMAEFIPCALWDVAATMRYLQE